MAIGAQNAFVLRQGLRREQVLPGIDTLAPGAQGPVKRLGAAADLAEIPIGEQIAQQAATQQQRDGNAVQNPREFKAYRHCDYQSLQHRRCGNGAVIAGKKQWHDEITAIELQ
mgnify:CR=1 FL=1